MRRRASRRVDETVFRDHSPGRPLEPHAQEDLGAWFGVSLADVRVHDDAGAADAAGALDASAFTHGSDIYLGEGHGVHERGLLAHEIAHTLQPRAPGADPTAAETNANAAVLTPGASTHAPRAAIQRQAAAEAPPRPASPIGDASLVAMKADVELIVARLKQQILWADEEQELVDRVRAWADWDESYRRSGGTGSPFLDKFLLLLKTRTFSRTTGRVMFGLAGEEWINAYDGLFYELEDDRLEQFKQLITPSRQATADAESKQMQSVYGYVGKRVGTGAWGIVKNISLSLTSIADTLVWVQWRSQGLPGDPPKLSKAVADQFDLAAKELAGAMAEGATREELEEERRDMMREYGFGDRWGTIVSILLTAEVGGPAIGIAQGAQGVEDAAKEVDERIAELRKQNPNVTWSEILADDKVRLGINHGLVSIIGIAAGAAGAGGGESALGGFFKEFGLTIGLANVVPQLQQAWIDWSDPALTPDERDAKLQNDIATIIGTIAATVGGHEQGGPEQARGEPPPETPPTQETPPPVERQPPPPTQETPPPVEQPPPPAHEPPSEESSVGPEAPGGKKAPGPEGEKEAPAYPDTLVHYGIETAAEAAASYTASLDADASREAGIWYDPANGEYVVVQGNEGSVATWWRGDPELAGRSWQLMRHFHPGADMSERIPSAADYQSMLVNQSLGREPRGAVQSKVDYHDASGNVQSTDFGYNPELGSEPYWLVYTDEAGTPQAKFFKEPPWEPASGYKKFLDDLGLFSRKAGAGDVDTPLSKAPEAPTTIDETTVDPETPKPARRRFTPPEIVIGELEPPSFPTEKVNPVKVGSRWEGLPEGVQAGVVYEFPGGEKMWRNPDMSVAILSEVGPAPGRAGYEKEVPARGEYDIEGYQDAMYELAHSQGQGTGFEAPDTPLAPRTVNQAYQRWGVEEFLYQLRDKAPPDMTFELLTNRRVYAGTRRLQWIEYRVRARTAGATPEPFFSFRIEVTGDVGNPTVRVVDGEMNPQLEDLLDVPDMSDAWAQQHRIIEEMERRQGGG